MEILIVSLAILCLLAAPAGLILGILSLQRVGRVQRELRRLAATGGGHSAVEPSFATDGASPEQTVAVAFTPRPAVPVPATTGAGGVAAAHAAPRRPRRTPGPKPHRGLDLETILGGQWLTWAGILALFFGTAFFLGVDLGGNGLSGLPQVLIGLGVAIIFGVAGQVWNATRGRFLGLGLLGGGVALTYLAAYAAFGFHGLIPLWVVFPLLLGVAVAGAVLALRNDSVTIASLTLVGALLTPMILQRAGNATTALLPYLVAVNLGAMLVGLRRGWAGLPLAAFLVTLAMVAGGWRGYDVADRRLFMAACCGGMWLIYALAPWLRRPSHRFWSFARAAVLAANGLIFGLFWYHLLSGGGEHLRGAALAGLAVVYLAISRLMRRREGEDAATRLTHLTGVALLLVAVPIQFDLAWVTLAWLALAGVLLWAGFREQDRWQRFSGLAVLVIVLFRSMLLDAPTLTAGALIRSGAGFRPLVNGGFLAGLALTGLLGWLAWAYHRHTAILSPVETKLRSPVLVAAVSGLAWKVSTEMLGAFAWRSAVSGEDRMLPGLLWVTLFWAVYGGSAVTVGLRTGLSVLRRTGYVVLACSLLVTTGLTLAHGVDLVGSYRPVLNLPLLQGVALSLALGALFGVLTRYRERLTAGERRLRTPLLVLGLCLLLVKISCEVTAFFALSDAVTTGPQELKALLALSLVWAGYAGLIIVAGFAARFKALRLLGITLLGVTVLKVFLVDMQALDKGYRIAAFVGLGVLLLAISILYQRERQQPRANNES